MESTYKLDLKKEYEGRKYLCRIFNQENKKIAEFDFTAWKHELPNIFSIRGELEESYRGKGLGVQFRKECFKQLREEKNNEPIGFISIVNAANYPSISYNLKAGMIPYINCEGEWIFIDSKITEKSMLNILEDYKKSLMDFKSEDCGSKEEIKKKIETAIKEGYEDYADEFTGKIDDETKLYLTIVDLACSYGINLNNDLCTTKN